MRMQELGRTNLVTSQEWRVDYVPEASSGDVGGTFVVMRRIAAGTEYEEYVEVMRTGFVYVNGLMLCLDDSFDKVCAIIREATGYK